MNHYDLRTTPGLLANYAEQFPDHLALKIDHGPSITYSEIDRQSTALACGLLDMGVCKGDLVALAFDASTWVESTISYFAVHKAGAIAALLPQHIAASGNLPKELHNVAAIVNPELIPLFLNRTHPFKWLRTTSQLLNQTSPEPLSISLDPASTCDVTIGSGTTGKPRILATSHDNITYMYRHHMVFNPPRALDADRPRHLLTRGPDIPQLGEQLRPFLRALPGQEPQMVIVMREFDPARLCELIDEYSISQMLFPPQIANVVFQSVDLNHFDLTSVRWLLVGSTRAPEAILRRIQRAFPNAYVEVVYGANELGPAGVGRRFNMDSGEAASNVGRPRSFVDCHGRTVLQPGVRILDHDESPVETGEIGEIWIHCPNMPQRFYFSDPARQAATFPEKDWIRPGDLGFLDANGNLHITDRKDDNITRGTQMISSLEVENVFYEHPAVIDAAVFAIPDDLLGEDVAVALVLKEQVAVADLRDFSRARLDSFKVPRMVFIVDEMPRNQRGKILKRKLRSMIRERLRTDSTS